MNLSIICISTRFVTFSVLLIRCVALSLEAQRSDRVHKLPNSARMKSCRQNFMPPREPHPSLVLCFVSVLSLSLPSRFNVANGQSNVEVVLGDDVSISFTMRCPLNTGENLFWMKDGSVQLRMCLTDGSCIQSGHIDSYLQRHNFTTKENINFSMSITKTQISDAGIYSYEIRTVGEVKYRKFIATLVVHERNPTCKAVHQLGSANLKLICKWVEKNGSGEGIIVLVGNSSSTETYQNENITDCNSSTSMDKMRNINVPLAFLKMFSVDDTRASCLFYQNTKEKHCNFSLFLEPKYKKVEVDITSTASFICCSTLKSVPEVYIWYKKGNMIFQLIFTQQSFYHFK